MARRKRTKRKNSLITIIVVILAIVGIIPTASEKLGGFSWDEVFEETQLTESVDGDYPVSVHFIDVGQGDCTLISSDYGNILIDSGEYEYAQTVVNYLKNYSVKKLDYVITTHPHSDHMGSMATILGEFEVGKFLMPKVAKSDIPTSKSYEKMLRVLSEKKIPSEYCGAGDSFSLGEIRCEAVAPVRIIEDNLNSMSIVMKFTYGDISLLVTGDCEKDEENDILSSGADIDCDILKVSHHGSKTSSSVAFLKKVSPEISVISLAKDNEYGHPHKVTIDNLEKIGTTIYRTDEKGSMIFSTDGEKIYCNF